MLPPSTCPQINRTPESWRCLGCQRPIIEEIVQLESAPIQRLSLLAHLHDIRKRCFQLLLERYRSQSK